MREVRLFWICDQCGAHGSTFGLSGDPIEDRRARLVEAHAIAEPDCTATAVDLRNYKTEAVRDAAAGSWGSGCARGFVSDSRFGSGQVIPRTNRDVSRKWRRVDNGRL